MSGRDQEWLGNLPTLEHDIAAWIEQQIEDGEMVPDFWDELDTSARLAEYLQKIGYRKVGDASSEKEELA